MADKYFINDYGSAIWHAGAAWTRTGSSNAQLPDSSLNIGDIPLIENSITYNVADPQGKVIYPAEEEAVALNLYLYQSTVSDILSTIIASVPTDGVLRCWVEDVGVNIDLYVNGIKLYSSGDTQAEAYPINVQVGDLIEVVNSTSAANRACKALIYPFAYSQ